MALWIFSRMLSSLFFILFLFFQSIGLASITDYVVAVDRSGTYDSIQSAIDAAVSKGENATIWIKNGVYKENLTLHSGVNLIGATGLGDFGDAEIIGTHNPPLEGHIILRNLKWSGDTSILYSTMPGTAHITMIDSCLNVKNGYAFYLPFWNGAKGGGIEFFDINPGNPAECQDGVIYNPFGKANVFLYNAGIGAGNTNTMQISGQMVMLAASINCPVHFCSNGKLQCDSGLMTAGVIFSEDSKAQISNSRISSISTSAIQMHSSEKIGMHLCVIDGGIEPVIDGNGQGTLALYGCVFPNSSTISRSIRLAK